MVRLKRFYSLMLVIIFFSITTACNNTAHVPSSNITDTSSETKENYLVIGKHQSTTIAAGCDFTIGIKTDGTVLATGNNNDGQCDVSDWTDIIAVSAGENHTVGLENDGTVIAVGNNEHGQCDVTEWTDIVKISAGGNHTVGLKKDGTVVATGINASGQCNVSDWSGITGISAGETHTVGLLADGSVLAVGSNIYGECDVSDWVNIVAVSAGSFCTAGVSKDGRVLFVGEDEMRQSEVSTWSDIAAISAGYPVVGLKTDGTATVFGTYSETNTETNTETNLTKYTPYNVADWNYIIAVAAGYTHIAALTDYGTVIAIGTNSDGQCNTSEWSSIALSAPAPDDSASQTEMPASAMDDNEKVSPEETSFSIGEAVKVNDITLTITNIEKVSGPEYTTLKSEEEYVVITVTIENTSSSDFYYTSSDFSLQNSLGVTNGFSTTKANEESRLKSGNLAPGSSVTGTIAFRAPKNDPSLVLRYCDNTFGEGAVYINLN